MTTVLIDAAKRFNIGPWEQSGRAAGFDWSVRKHEIGGGRQDGVELLVVNNGRMEIVLVPTRGMGLWDARVGDLRLGWDSPTGEIVHPKYINPESRGGLGWLEGFGEWVVRCGLENNGGAGPDTVLNNNGAEVSMNLPLHGKIANIPASGLSFEFRGGAEPALVVRGTVVEGCLFGMNYILETTIVTAIGSATVTVHDRVINNSEKPSEFELLYHCNYGPPILDEGAKLIVAAERVTPRDARAAETGMDNYNTYPGPTPGTTEQCYFLKLYGDANNNTAALLRNGAGDRGVIQRWPLNELPWFTLWKNPQGLRDGYVTGMEPATNYPNPRRHERTQGRVPVLVPGAHHDATMVYEALPDAASVARAEQEIDAILNGRPTQLDPGPVDGISR